MNATEMEKMNKFWLHQWTNMKNGASASATKEIGACKNIPQGPNGRRNMADVVCILSLILSPSFHIGNWIITFFRRELSLLKQKINQKKTSPAPLTGQTGFTGHDISACCILYYTRH